MEYSNDSHLDTTTHEHLHSSKTSSNTFPSGEVAAILQWIIWATIPQIIDICGIAGNVINIICFVKQGFQDTVNVTFVGLAITDLGCLFTAIWTNLCFTPAFYALDLPFEAIEFQFMITGIPHVMFARISSWITAVITLERCLCITMPLKVKDMVTPKRVCIIIIVIFLVLTLSGCPMYFVYNLGSKYYPEINKTMLGIIYVGDRDRFDTIFFPVSCFLVSISAFVVIIVCTVILVIELNNKAKWRQKSTSSDKADNLSRSNIRVAKMVVMISILFIACFIPSGIISIAMPLIPELSIDGKFRHLLTLLGGVGFLLESVNSSANMFIYYRMSSKYRDAIRNIFKMRQIC